MDRSIEKNDLLQRGFLSRTPKIGQFPHLLVPSGKRTLAIVSKTAGCFLGLWGERPMYREDGSNYLEPPDSKITEDFKIWSLPKNQEYLLERANVGPDPEFKMFICADTPTAVLLRTYEHFNLEPESSKWFGNYIDWICDWLPGLNWALIPLEGEVGWSIFAASHKYAQLVNDMKKAFQNEKIRISQIIQDDNRGFRWVDNAEY